MTVTGCSVTTSIGAAADAGAAMAWVLSRARSTSAWIIVTAALIAKAEIRPKTALLRMLSFMGSPRLRESGGCSDGRRRRGGHRGTGGERDGEGGDDLLGVHGASFRES